jgi:murein L,D-transpeptidase YcbB/YkuD
MLSRAGGDNRRINISGLAGSVARRSHQFGWWRGGFMGRLAIRLALSVCMAASVAAVACGPSAGESPGGRAAGLPPAPTAPPRALQAGPPPRADIQAAIRILLEAERHPWLKWPDITRFLPALAAIADEEPDGLFWFVDGAAHPALDGAIETLTHAEAQGLDPADFDAATLATHWRQLRAGTKATATEWAEFDSALSVASMRLLSSLHVGRVDPRVVGIGYDVAAKRMDPLEAVRSARDGGGGLAAAADRVRPQTAAYQRLVDALGFYRRLAAVGDHSRVPALTGQVKKVEPGQPWAGVPALDARLRLTGDLRADTPTPDSTIEAPLYSKELALAVERFQDRHALEPDGVIGPSTLEALNVPFAARVRQLELALERQRWLPDLGGKPFVFVNVPLFRLWATDPKSGEEPIRMRVVVGKAIGHATPIFIDEMEYIVFRPYWNPPPSILRSEIVPKARRDPGYLARE